MIGWVRFKQRVLLFLRFQKKKKSIKVLSIALTAVLKMEIAYCMWSICQGKKWSNF